MSLLNQVLRDLQDRQVAPLQRPLGEGVQAVPLPGRIFTGSRVLLLLVGVGLLGVGGYFFLLTSAKTDESIGTRVQAPVFEDNKFMQAAQEAARPISPNRLAALRMQEDAGATRLLLEFARPLKNDPQVTLKDNQLRVVMPDLVFEPTALPEGQLNSGLLKGLQLTRHDRNLVLEAGIGGQARVQSVRLEADSLHGERLAIDIQPLAENAPKPREKTRAVATKPQSEPKRKIVKPIGLAKTEIQLSPVEQARDMYLHGVTAQEQGDRTRAEGYWRQALRLDPAHIAARQQLIRLLVRTDRPQAENFLAEGLTLPEASDLRIWYARLLLSTYGAAEAVSSLEKVSAPEQSAELLALRAGLWQQVADYLRAESDYRELVRRVPASGLYRFGLAVALDQRAEPEALGEYRKALELGLKPELIDYAQTRVAQLEKEKRALN